MHLITIRNLRQDAAPYPDVQKQLNDWNDIVKGAEWQSVIEVQTIYRDAAAHHDCQWYSQCRSHWHHWK